jgi:hypothetical protein
VNLKQLKEKGGNGFTMKEDHNKLALTKCPECHRENYAMNVLTGCCTWCGFDVNAEEIK